MSKLGDFTECPQCANKPGSPDLCEACLNNRRVIEKLYDVINLQDKKLRVIRDIMTF
jgi:hypothetical protein